MQRKIPVFLMSFLVAMLVIFCAAPLLSGASTVFAEEEYPVEYDEINDSGKCGTNVTWQIKEHYVKTGEYDINLTKTSLIISGTGAMTNYAYQQ